MSCVPNPNFEQVVKNIRLLASLTYTTVGIVLTEQNANRLANILEFANSLGVADIRAIPAAQFTAQLAEAKVSYDTKAFPILNYRLRRARAGKLVRGLSEGDVRSCPLVLDDMAVCGDQHYPCIIYLREGGNPIGSVSAGIRKERHRWFERHDAYADPICSKQCLDVCADYNERWNYFNSSTREAVGV
jgi:hypothetical protein